MRMVEELKPPWELKPRTLIRVEAETNPSYGEDPYKRPLKKLLRLGVINLDKPRGPTSHEVTAKVRELLGVKRAGHGGTLDPAVSGVLPILLDDATKCAGAVMSGGKEYVCLMRLHCDIPYEKVEEAVRFFTGEIYQVPPVRSSVARTIRRRIIYRSEILEHSGRDILLRVACSGGTYMRKLCYDLGLYLKCGAHMQELRRTRAGPFTEDDSVTLLSLYEALLKFREEGDESELRRMIKPVEEAVKHLPKLCLLDTAVDAICHGANLAVAGISKVESTVRKRSLVAMMTLKGELIALGRSLMDAEEILERSEGIAVDTERVIMEKGTYPPIWKGGRRSIKI